jgi:transglutaminase-like putative cysteine protease
MHAWTELFLPGAGWKGFDPTNGILCSDLFIPVAVARFPETVNPIQGAYLNKAQVPNRMECHVEMTDLVP